jgi:hypothetical protein
LYALSPDGVLKWKTKVEYAYQYPPVIGSDGTIYVISLFGTLYALNQDGTLKWKEQIIKSGFEPKCTIGNDGIIYIGNDYLYSVVDDSDSLSLTQWPKIGHDNQNTRRIKVNYKSICSKDKLNNCSNQDECEKNDGYWYNDKCNSTPICDESHLENCDNETKCKNAGGFWYDNKCNPKPICDSSNLTTCDNLTKCEKAGGYWYNNKCINSKYINNNAEPPFPLYAVLYKPTAKNSNPDPTDILIKVPVSSKVYIQPELQVDDIDVGKNATLIMYAYLKKTNTWIPLPSKNVTLKSIQKFDILNSPLNFSNSEGLDLYIYYGYVIGKNIKYNAYEIIFIKKPSIPACSKYLDETSCNSIKGCIYTTDMFGNSSCKLNCSQYTNKKDCISAFDGNSCIWIEYFETCVNK